MDNAVQRYMEDFPRWCEECVTVIDKLTGAPVPFRLNAPQRRVAAVMEGQRRQGRPIRLILLKARQWGGSTLVQVYMAWMQMVRHRGWNSLICGHVKDASANIRGMYSMLLREYPASLKGERQVNAVDLANARMRLGAMAGGTISWHGDAYMPYEMPADLSAYTGEATSRDPEVMKAREEIAAAASQEKLRRREGLPGFSLGYTSEMMRDDNHYGVSVGVSLPLWGNHGRVKAAKAARVAAEAAAEDARFQSEMRLRGSWQKAMALRDVADECRVLSRECDNTADIEKLYKLGQLSAQDYLAQLGSLMSLERRVIDADYAWQQALAEFRAAGAAY